MNPMLQIEVVSPRHSILRHRGDDVPLQAYLRTGQREQPWRFSMDCLERSPIRFDLPDEFEHVAEPLLHRCREEFNLVWVVLS